MIALTVDVEHYPATGSLDHIGENLPRFLKLCRFHGVPVTLLTTWKAASLYCELLSICLVFYEVGMHCHPFY